MTSAAMHIARTGLDAQDMRMRVISNNLANVNTTGYKKDRAAFETLAYQTITAPGAASTSESKYATGPEPRHRRAHPGHRADRHAGVDADHRQQPRPRARRRRLFPGAAARRPARLYPRGQFLALGRRVAGHQRRLSGAARHHHSRRRDRDHHRHRRHCVGDRARPDRRRQQIGQIQVASFPNASGPSADRRQLPDRDRRQSGAANLGIAGQDGRGNVRQGELEASNVNVVEELVDMIECQRAYEVNSAR